MDPTNCINIHISGEHPREACPEKNINKKSTLVVCSSSNYI